MAWDDVFATKKSKAEKKNAAITAVLKKKVKGGFGGTNLGIRAPKSKAESILRSPVKFNKPKPKVVKEQQAPKPKSNFGWIGHRIKGSGHFGLTPKSKKKANKILGKAWHKLW
jgi:hypothetical protein